MKRIASIILISLIVSWLEIPISFAQPPWGEIPIPGQKGKKKEKSKIPKEKEPEKKVRIYKDYKTRQLEYKQFYSSFIINDGTIDKEERIFLDQKKAELELSDDEVESLEFLVKLESPRVPKKD